jgi:hypothetical protein
MQLRSGNITEPFVPKVTNHRKRSRVSDSETIDAAKSLCKLAVHARTQQRLQDFKKLADYIPNNHDDTESDIDESEQDVVLDSEEENETEEEEEDTQTYSNEKMDYKPNLISNPKNGLKYQLHTFSTTTFPKHSNCVINLQTPFQKTLINTKRASLLMCHACVNNTHILLELQMRCSGCNIYWCKQTSDWVYQFDDKRDLYAIGLTNHQGKKQHIQPFNYVPFQSGLKKHVATMYSRALDCLFFYNTETQLYEGNLNWDFQQKRLFVKKDVLPNLDMKCFFR